MSEFGKIAGLIVEDYYKGRFDLSQRVSVSSPASWSEMPQVECVQFLRESGASDRTVLLYLTFLTAVDRTRDSEQCWWSGVELYDSNPEVFDPLQLFNISIEQLTGLLNESGVTQNTTQDPEAWLNIAQTIAIESNCPVSRVIYGKTVDARQLTKDLGTRGEDGKSRFPLLSGPKTGHKWILVLANPGGADISHLDALPITADSHVRRATENLRMIKKDRPDSEADSDYIQSVWRSAVALMHLEEPDAFKDTCAGLTPALSFFGRYGCGHCEKISTPVRFGRACNHCRLFL